ncbi:5-oxoprolinase subunit B family protein [Pelagibacterium lentulum]|uniref:Allophanate hydrolase n=1 Tax=Pelagibacterium lentulum TaxID=2029865 RepID=A0A916VYG9_9HYPH|nr:allophanate hydrolase subunit 1 [Pelagibacterium lentulum]GGA52914.1 allophanate hydrolase [Pelagibacterium lentulum]
MTDSISNDIVPTLMPLGDAGMLVKFSNVLSDMANRRAIGFSRLAEAKKLPGVVEVVPNLVSVLLRYDPIEISFSRLAGEVRMALQNQPDALAVEGGRHEIAVVFGGESGPDLNEVAKLLDLEPEAFVEAHNSAPLRVIATGFAPGFVYCGMHEAELVVPRRAQVRRIVPAGSVLFAAGQTAIAATDIPTGWHVIGRTDFRNFDPGVMPPTRLRAGDTIVFAAAEGIL